VVEKTTGTFLRVQMQAIVDKPQRTERYSETPTSSGAGIRTVISHKHAISHSKFILIDGQKIVMGSFNFSNVHEHSNVENLLVIKCKDLAKYDWNWRTMRSTAGSDTPAVVALLPGEA
jgi:phosphatidylserine/phosphatidylglycerophosphate/cardiolipin synthase-like enzyme